MNKKGVLLINLGTPDNCDNKSVYSYLTQFLNDPYVIDLPFFMRWPLVNLVIVPFRHKKTAEAYQKIWTKEGSPLRLNSMNLAKALSVALGSDYQVELGMRYGKPSITSAIEKLKNTEEIIVIPLFPQYSHAATGSAIAKVSSLSKPIIIKDFYNNPGFIESYAEIIKNNTANKNIDFILFSYHGLPDKPINQIYQNQCHETTRLITEKLNLSKDHYQTTFQSRLGRTPWIKPYTDLVLPELIQKGIKNIAIVCPSFVADCLETLEEINIRAREQWQSLGGSEFTFIPCLNADSQWVEALASIVLKQTHSL